MEQIYTVLEVAKYLKISKSKLYLMIARREIPFIRIGVKSVRIRESDLIKWLEEQKRF